MQNTSSPFFNIPAEISSKFTTVEEAIQWWKDQEPPKPPTLTNPEGEQVNFSEASVLAVKHLTEALEEEKRKVLGSIDLFDLAKLSSNNFEVTIEIK